MQHDDCSLAAAADWTEQRWEDFLPQATTIEIPKLQIDRAMYAHSSLVLGSSKAER